MQRMAIRAAADASSPKTFSQKINDQNGFGAEGTDQPYRELGIKLI
jgi:hypothetical protein